MEKKFDHITDKELYRLFRDAAEKFKPLNAHAPEGAWEGFLNEHLNQEATPFDQEIGADTHRPRKRVVYRSAVPQEGQ